MWVPQSADEQIVPFFVEDSTGRAWIAAERGSIRIAGGRRESGQTGKRATSRYVARVIAAGDVVRIRGQVGESRKGEPKGPVLRGSREHPLDILFRKSARQ